MPQPSFHVRLGWSGWLSLLIALALVLTVAAVLAIVLLGVFIILLPVVIISGVVYYFFPGLRNRYREQWRETETIEGEYRVVDPSQIRIDSPDRDRT
jgi:small neutral amino acid transporter SnatA (MarC family)